MIRRCLALLFTLLLAACGTTAPERIPDSASYKVAGESGIVFGSLGASLNSGGITIWGLQFRRVGAAEPAQFRYIYDGLFDTPVDFQGDRARGSVFFARLPAGEYEVFNIDLFQNLGQMTRTFHAAQPFSLRFKVEPNRPVYLGDFMGYRVTGDNFFGLPITAGGYFVVTDMLARDAGLLAKKNVSIDIREVDNQSGAFLQLNTPVFQKPKAAGL